MRLAACAILAACHATPATETTAPTPLPSHTVAATEPSPGCANDGDCTISNEHGCCVECASPPFAELKRDADGLKARCANAECAKRPEPMLCKPTEETSAYNALCRAARCEAVKK